MRFSKSKKNDKLQPFNSGVVDEIKLPYSVLAGNKSMISDNEAKMLYHLARDVAQPGMEIVDAGAFSGGSARALAAGLEVREDREMFFRRIHSYDMFVVTSEYYKRLLSNTAEIGDTFLPQYMNNIRPWGDYINVYPGDFSEFKWFNRPISILFADICKTPKLDRHLWETFAPSMVPDKSYLIQQDFVHIQAPFVHVALGKFIDHFEAVGLINSSLVLKYVKPIPQENTLDGTRLYQRGSVLEKIESIEKLVNKVKPIANEEALGTLELVKANIAVKHQDHALTETILKKVIAQYGHIDKPYFLARIRYIEKALDGL